MMMMMIMEPLSSLLGMLCPSFVDHAPLTLGQPGPYDDKPYLESNFSDLCD